MIINILSVDFITDVIDLEVNRERKEHGHIRSLFKDQCPELWAAEPTLSATRRLYFSITSNARECFGDSYFARIRLGADRDLTKSVLKQRLYDYFRQRAIVGYDFVDNIEVWIEDSEQKQEGCTQYLRFSIVPKDQTVTSGWELLVSYNGHSIVYDTPLSALDLKATRYKVIVGDEVVKVRDLTPEQKREIFSIFPVVNKELSRELGVIEHYEKIPNRYADTLPKIRSFAKEYLYTEEFNSTVLKITCNDFITVPDDKLTEVTQGSNVLLFGRSQISFDPYTGLFGNRNGGGYGPYSATEKTNVRFFFIAQESQKDVCRSLYCILKDGMVKNPSTGAYFQKYKSLADDILQPFNTDKNGSIFFQSVETAVEDIRAGLAKKQWDDNAFYVALYISPVDRDDPNPERHDIYFKVKEMLLEKGVTSQAIYNENPGKNAFQFHLPNIKTAILAKIGGIPWQLQTRKKSNDVIIGVGAFKSEKIGKRYIGSAFCFNNEGVFQNFDCYRDDDLDSLVGDIRKALGHFVIESGNPDRVIIHYYKTMKERDSAKITDMLYKLGFSIPVYIVTINKTEASDYVGFDTEDPGLMPKSGTIVRLSYNEFLLYNNARYDKPGRYDFLFPVKLKLKKVYNNAAPEDKELRMDEARALLNQVYKFSRMYWKSVKQQNLPITIKYPEMVAEIVPHFRKEELPAFGKTNLWFL